MRVARQVIAVTLVATAVCAERAIALPWEPATSTASFAGRWMDRLEGNLQQVVPAVRLAQPIRAGIHHVVPAPETVAADLPAAPPASLSPFQFRLPPPLV